MEQKHTVAYNISGRWEREKTIAIGEFGAVFEFVKELAKRTSKDLTGHVLGAKREDSKT